MSAYNQNNFSASPTSSSERKRFDLIFVAQHSTCLQQELNKEYSIQKMFKQKKQKRENNSNKTKQEIHYSPSQSKNSQLNNIKETFQRAQYFQESPLSIRHLDSIGQSDNNNHNNNHNNDNKIIYKSIHNESCSNLNNQFQDIFKANSVECTPKYLKRKFHFNLNDKSYKFEEDKLEKRKGEENQNQSKDEDFFFTTASIDNRQEESDYKQRNRRRKYDLYSLQQGDNSRNNTNSINSQLSRRANNRSIESISKTIHTRHESYQTRQSKKLLKLPNLSNQLSKSLLKSYKECQNSMEELENIERSISQKSIFQYDLVLPENQHKLVQQKSKWENRALEYISEKKYQNFQDRKHFSIFEEGIDKRIHRFYIDEEQKRKNLLVKKLQQALQGNQKNHFVTEQKRDHFRDELFYQKYGISPRDKRSAQKEEPQNVSQFYYAPEIEKKNTSSRRVSPNPQTETTQITHQSHRKEIKKPFSYQKLLKDETDSSLSKMLETNLSSIAYTKRSRSKQIENKNSYNISQKLPNLNKIYYPLQEFQSKVDDFSKSPQNRKQSYKNPILKEELVEFNIPIDHSNKSRQQ